MENKQTNLDQFLTDNLVDIQSAKRKLEKTSKDFIESNENVYARTIPIKELLPIFSTKKLIEIRKGIVKRSATEFLIASLRQRDKSSQILNTKEGFQGTTWNENGIASGLISWIVGTSSPTVKINVNTLESDNVVTIWDGESKFQIVWHFVINRATNMFRVLNDNGSWNEEVSNFMKHPQNFTTDKNAHLVEMLKQMFNEAKKTKKYYVSVEWMINLKFDELVKSLIELGVTCQFQNLPEMVEGETYHREGRIGARQSDVQLTNSQMKDAWYELVRYEETRQPKNRFKDALRSSIFNDKNSPFFTDIYDDVHSGENYQGYDEYIYDFILSNLFNIERNKVSYGFSEDIEMSTLAGIARPYDKGTRIVSDKMKSFKEYILSEHISDTEKDTFKNKLVSIFKMIENAFGYQPSKNFQYGNGFGLKDRGISYLFTKKTPAEKKKGQIAIKELQTQELREFLWDNNIDRPKNLGYIDKFIIGNHLITYMVIKSITYILQHPDVKDNQLSEILTEIVQTSKSEWIEYVTEFDTIGCDDTKNWYDTQQIEETKDKTESDDDPSFGCLYALNGGNLEKVAWVWLKFYNDIIEPKLDSIYVKATSTTKEMRKFKSWLSKEKSIVPEQFFIFDTENTTALGLDKFDIGHPDAESYGNILFHKEFLMEERVHNRHKYQTHSKNLKSYYKCLMANHNDIVNKCKEDLQKDINDMTLAKMNEANRALVNLKLLLEYLGVEYDETASYKNATAVKEEYIM